VRIVLATLTIPLLAMATVLGADDDPKSVPKSSNPPVPKSRPTAAVDADREADALGFVRQHHPELATVLEALKPMNPLEYNKAIGELSQVSRTLAELKTRNPKRYELALDAWKAKSRVELLAAQLAGSPTEEIRSQLRLAIEAKVDVEIRRQRFELEQAEQMAKKAREALDRLESQRDSIVETRFRALQPKKSLKAKKSAPAKPANTPANVNVPANPNGEDRR
jgi:hypothetical protein